MAYRKKMSRSRSKKVFRRGANRIDHRNVSTRIQRGGYRL